MVARRRSFSMDSACPWLAQWILTIFHRDGSKPEARFRSGSRCCPRDFSTDSERPRLVQSISAIFNYGGSKPEAVFVARFSRRTRCYRLFGTVQDPSSRFLPFSKMADANRKQFSLLFFVSVTLFID